MFARHKDQWDPSGKVVLIAGATRGLGLELSRQLSGMGAALAVCGTDAARLAMVEAELSTRGTPVVAERCDVTDVAQVNAFVSRALERFGRIDAVVNCAGILTVGSAVALTEADYRESMDVMLHGPVLINMAVLSAMLERGEGRIVNIGSLGGEVGMPRMSAYSAAKAALLAYSRALAIEMEPEGISVTTVIPGFMRTGAHVNGCFKGRHRADYAWFSLASSLPLMSIDAAGAARRIIRALQRGEREVLLGPAAHAGVFFMRQAHGLTDAVLRLAHRLLPGTNEHGLERLGFQSTTALSESVLTKLGRDAAKVYRQYGPLDEPSRLLTGPWDTRESIDRREAA